MGHFRDFICCDVLAAERPCHVIQSRDSIVVRPRYFVVVLENAAAISLDLFLPICVDYWVVPFAYMVRTLS